MIVKSVRYFKTKNGKFYMIDYEDRDDLSNPDKMFYFSEGNKKIYPYRDNITKSKSGVDRNETLSLAYQNGEAEFPPPTVGTGASNALMNASAGTMVENWSNSYGDWGFKFDVLTDKKAKRHYINKFSDNDNPKNYYGPKTAGMQSEAITITAPNGKVESFALDHWTKSDDELMAKKIQKWMESNLDIVRKEKTSDYVAGEDLS